MTSRSNDLLLNCRCAHPACRCGVASAKVGPGMATTALDREHELQNPRAGTGSGRLLASALLASLGSFLFGFDTAVISGTTASLRTAFGLNDNSLGFTVSSALFGTMAGALLAGRPADWWGRRRMLVLLAGLFLVSSVGCAAAWNWYALLAFRWLGGVAVGAASVVCPVYITEIAPAHRRGVLVAVSQLNIVVGVLLSYLSNYLVARLVGADNPAIWRWMFGVMMFPSLVFVLAGAVIPESPRWLVKQGRSAEAKDVLVRLGHAEPAAELGEIEASLREEKAGAQLGLFQRKYLKPMLLAGSVTFMISHLLAAWVFQTHAHGWVVLVAMMGIVGSHAYSQGAVVWVCINEVLPNAVRASGSAAACILLWVLDLGVSWSFPVVAGASAAYAFAFFAAMMAAQFVLVLLFFPETKGLSLEQLQQRLGA
jgi:MFS family permease